MQCKNFKMLQNRSLQNISTSVITTSVLFVSRHCSATFTALIIQTESWTTGNSR